jgi:hypothetical protein
MIKKYNQFVKQKVNENIDEPSFEETEGKLAAQDLEDETLDYSDDEYLLNKSGEGRDMYDDSEEEEEEEAGDIYNKRLQELADLLGSEVTDGKIIHNGEEIIFPSETEMFHVGKKKFKTADEAAKYILSDKVTTESKSYKNRYK